MNENTQANNFVGQMKRTLIYHKSLTPFAGLVIQVFALVTPSNHHHQSYTNNNSQQRSFVFKADWGDLTACSCQIVHCALSVYTRLSSCQLFTNNIKTSSPSTEFVFKTPPTEKEKWSGFSQIYSNWQRTHTYSAWMKLSYQMCWREKGPVEWSFYFRTEEAASPQTRYTLAPPKNNDYGNRFWHVTWIGNGRS